MLSIASNGPQSGVTSSPAVETLESRLLLTATTITNGVLYVEGSRRADKIVMAIDAGNANRLAVNVNGTRSFFNLADVSWVDVVTGRGDDYIRVDDSYGVVEVRRRLMGGYNNDTIIGGARRDEIRGSYSEDTFVGGAGRDTIYGGAGNDNINGGKSSDHIYAEAGDDRVTGGGGHDTILGGTGGDYLDGYYGDDYILGHEDDDTLIGCFGNDMLKGGSGDDGAYGNDGQDILDGDAGVDSLEGGPGEDAIKDFDDDNADGEPDDHKDVRNP